MIDLLRTSMELQRSDSIQQRKDIIEGQQNMIKMIANGMGAATSRTTNMLPEPVCERDQFFTRPMYTEDDRDKLGFLNEGTEAAPFPRSTLNEARKQLLASVEQNGAVGVGYPMDLETKTWIPFSDNDMTCNISFTTTSEVWKKGIQGWEVIIQMYEMEQIDLEYDHEYKEFAVTLRIEHPPQKKVKSGNDLSLSRTGHAGGSN